MGDGFSGDPLNPPPPPRTGRGPVVALALLALIAVGAAVLLLRPESGQSADGSRRQATTTTILDQTSTTEEGLAPDESVVPDGLVVEEVAGLAGVDTSVGAFTVVPGPDGVGGYFGVSTRGSTSVPDVFRSLTGQNWVRVETSVDEDTSPGGPGIATQFTGFHRRPDGFGVFRIRSELSELVSQDLLTSQDGALWAVSAAAGEQPPAAGFSVVIDDDFASVFVREDAGLAILERSGIIIPLSEPCFVSPRNPDSILVSPCNDTAEERVEVLRSEVQDVDAFDRAYDCLETSVNVSFSTVEIRFPGEGPQTGTFFTNRQLRGLPVRLDAGPLIGLAAGVAAQSAACEPFRDLLPPRSNEGVVIWDEPGDAIVVELDSEPDFLSNDFFGVQLVPVGDTVFTLGAEGLWAIELDGSIEQVIDLGERDFGATVHANLAASDGVALLSQVVDGALVQQRAEADGSTSRVVQPLAVERSELSARGFIYVDEDIVIFRDDRLVLRHIEVS